MLIEEEFVDEILRIFAIGSKIELILNILLYSNFSRWSEHQLKTFIEEIRIITESSNEQNKIYLCYNPILVICLCSEFLKNIG